MFSFFKKKPKAAAVSTTFVFAHVNAKVMPIDRGERFEDPLDKVLRKAGLGETTGGGSGLSENGEIDFSGIDIEVVDLDKGIPLITSTLERLGAPKGSHLDFQRDGQDASVPFGTLEGLAIYLNGTDLPDEVYAKCHPDELIKMINRALAGRGATRDNWQGPTETALYLYGASADAMQVAIKDVLVSYPLCQRARVLRIA